MDLTLGIILIVLALFVGALVTFALYKIIPALQAKNAAKKADKIIRDAEIKAEQIRKNAQIDGKQAVQEMRNEAEKDIRERKQEYYQLENKLNQREANIDKRDANLINKENALEEKNELLNRRLKECDKKENVLQTKIDSIISELEKVAQLSVKEARDEIFARVESKMSMEIAAYIKNREDEAKTECEEKAKNILSYAISKFSQDVVTEKTVSTVSLPSDEMKGRIIGREGRNIRALEAATGVEIVVDDTPEAIVISAFDPIRREVCRLALHQLVTDGRIHPARIEEVVQKVKKQLDNEVIETGKRTAIDLGIHGLHPELIRIVGKMKYRSSYGQNLLQHARETANLCAVMASELGLNPKKAKRAGLLHDIGKVPDEESELPHALYGAKIAEKYKEKPDICNAIAAHHDECDMNTLLAPIVQVCDAISGARPGARREIVEAYIKRLNDLEAIAMSYPGVTKTYAIQAGRELRVIVGADKMDDAETEALSGEIANKIQNEMTYPGQVKITVIRETRSVAYAK